VKCKGQRRVVVFYVSYTLPIYQVQILIGLPYVWFMTTFHVILYTLLFSCCKVSVWVVGIKSCCNVVVALNAIPMLVFLNKFVILLILRLWYVNMVQILCFVSLYMCLTFLCIWWLNFWSRRRGKFLFFAMDYIIFHYFCFLSGSRGRECVRVMGNMNAVIFCSMG
jgi:hypothetical protein